jgi:regulator of nucleoside diphosphate kinase
MPKGMIINQTDFTRIKNLLGSMRSFSERDSVNLRKLHDSLTRAIVVAPGEVPENVVTMNSRVSVRVPETEEQMEYTLVYPEKADYRKGLISILAPLGAALIGSRIGEVISWEVPKGRKNLEIREIYYQPEANGDFNA